MYGNNMYNNQDRNQSLFSNNIVQNTNVEVDNSNDIPPTLGSIEQLNNTPTFIAPSLSVLDAPNIMPENPNDILSSYDNGLLPGQIPNNEFTPSSLINNTQSSFEMPAQVPNSMPSYSPIMPSMGTEMQGASQMVPQQTEIAPSFEMPAQVPNSMPSYSPIMPSTGTEMQGASQIDTQNTIDLPEPKITNNDVTNEQDVQVTQDNIIFPETEVVLENKNFENNSSFETESQENISNEDNSIEIENNISVADEEEFEMLDMEEVEIDNSKEPEVSETDKDYYEGTLSIDVVNKIRNYVESMGLSKDKLSIEEFDFEDMFQLVIKINK